MISAMMEITVLIPLSYPLDTIKSRMQTNYYKNYKECFSKSTNFEHFKGLYRGSSFLYAGLMVRQPMKMVAFESASTPFYGSLCATVAGLITGIPISLLKTNYQIFDNFKVDLHMLKKMNLFRAWNYEIVKESVGNITFFSIYGIARRYNNIYGDKHVDKMNFINGTISSMIATFLAYPVDIMKVRKQTTHKTNSVKEIFDTVAFNNGKFSIINFWKGITPIFIRVSVFGGVGMFVYEKIRTILAKYI